MPKPEKTPRQMLALIALAIGLPMPRSVSFYNNDMNALNLSFDNAVDGQTWMRHLGHEPIKAVLDGYRYVGQIGVITWHGWDMNFSGREPVQNDDGPTGDDQAALTRLAEIDATDTPGGEG